MSPEVAQPLAILGVAATSSGSNSVVECQLPKLKVAGSTPVSRSITFNHFDPQRLVFVDEAGGRHGPVACVGATRRNWSSRGRRIGGPMTMIGAIRQDLGHAQHQWRAVTKVTFTVWVRQRLAPRLRPGTRRARCARTWTRPFAPSKPVERRCASCRPTLTTSIRSKRRGVSSRTSEAMRPARHVRCAASRKPRAMWSHRASEVAGRPPSPAPLLSTHSSQYSVGPSFH